MARYLTDRRGDAASSGVSDEFFVEALERLGRISAVADHVFASATELPPTILGLIGSYAVATAATDAEVDAVLVKRCCFSYERRYGAEWHDRMTSALWSVGHHENERMAGNASEEMARNLSAALTLIGKLQDRQELTDAIASAKRHRADLECMLCT